MYASLKLVMFFDEAINVGNHCADVILFGHSESVSHVSVQHIELVVAFGLRVVVDHELEFVLGHLRIDVPV